MSENANNMHLYMKEVSKRAGLFLNSHLIFRLIKLWIVVCQTNILNQYILLLKSDEI